MTSPETQLKLRQLKDTDRAFWEELKNDEEVVVPAESEQLAEDLQTIEDDIDDEEIPLEATIEAIINPGTEYTVAGQF